MKMKDNESHCVANFATFVMKNVVFFFKKMDNKVVIELIGVQ